MGKKPTDFFTKPDIQVLAVIAKEVKEGENSALNAFSSKEPSRVGANTGSLWTAPGCWKRACSGGHVRFGQHGKLALPALVLKDAADV